MAAWTGAIFLIVRSSFFSFLSKSSDALLNLFASLTSLIYWTTCSFDFSNSSSSASIFLSKSSKLLWRVSASLSQLARSFLICSCFFKLDGSFDDYFLKSSSFFPNASFFFYKSSLAFNKGKASFWRIYASGFIWGSFLQTSSANFFASLIFFKASSSFFYASSRFLIALFDIKSFPAFASNPPFI